MSRDQICRPAGLCTQRPPVMDRDRVILLGTLLAFGVWTAAVFTPPLGKLDLAVTVWLHHHASSTLDILLSVVTIAGNVEITAALTGLVAVALIRAEQTRRAVTLWAVFVGGNGIEWVTKHWFPHLGVPESLQQHGVSIWHHVFRTPYSYMSGHSFRTLLLAAVVPGIWALAAARKRRLSYFLGAIVALMGVALVYMGDHWTSEVIGGYLLAAVGIVLLRFV